MRHDISNEQPEVKSHPGYYIPKQASDNGIAAYYASDFHPDQTYETVSVKETPVDDSNAIYVNPIAQASHAPVEAFNVDITLSDRHYKKGKKKYKDKVTIYHEMIEALVGSIKDFDEFATKYRLAMSDIKTEDSDFGNLPEFKTLFLMYLQGALMSEEQLSTFIQHLHTMGFTVNIPRGFEHLGESRNYGMKNPIYGGQAAKHHDRPLPPKPEYSVPTFLSSLRRVTRADLIQMQQSGNIPETFYDLGQAGAAAEPIYDLGNSNQSMPIPISAEAIYDLGQRDDDEHFYDMGESMTEDPAPRVVDFDPAIYDMADRGALAVQAHPDDIQDGFYGTHIPGFVFDDASENQLYDQADAFEDDPRNKDYLKVGPDPEDDEPVAYAVSNGSVVVQLQQEQTYAVPVVGQEEQYLTAKKVNLQKKIPPVYKVKMTPKSAKTRKVLELLQNGFVGGDLDLEKSILPSWCSSRACRIMTGVLGLMGIAAGITYAMMSGDDSEEFCELLKTSGLILSQSIIGASSLGLLFNNNKLNPHFKERGVTTYDDNHVLAVINECPDYNLMLEAQQLQQKTTTKTKTSSTSTKRHTSTTTKKHTSTSTTKHSTSTKAQTSTSTFATATSTHTKTGTTAPLFTTTVTTKAPQPRTTTTATTSTPSSSSTSSTSTSSSSTSTSSTSSTSTSHVPPDISFECPTVAARSTQEGGSIPLTQFTANVTDGTVQTYTMRNFNDVRIINDQGQTITPVDGTVTLTAAQMQSFAIAAPNSDSYGPGSLSFSATVFGNDGNTYQTAPFSCNMQFNAVCDAYSRSGSTDYSADQGQWISITGQYSPTAAGESFPQIKLSNLNDVTLGLPDGQGGFTARQDLVSNGNATLSTNNGQYSYGIFKAQAGSTSHNIQPVQDCGDGITEIGNPVEIDADFFATTTTPGPTTTTKATTTPCVLADCSVLTCDQVRAERLCECLDEGGINNLPGVQPLQGCKAAGDACSSQEYSELQKCVQP